MTLHNTTNQACTSIYLHACSLSNENINFCMLKSLNWLHNLGALTVKKSGVLSTNSARKRENCLIFFKGIASWWAWERCLYISLEQCMQVSMVTLRAAATTKAMSHWWSQQIYSVLTITYTYHNQHIREGGEGAKAHYRYELHLRETAYFHTADKQNM